MSELVRIDERVPAGDRIDFYRDMCAGTWVPMDVSFDRSCERADVDLAGEFRASGMGAMQVGVMDLMPVTVRRTERHIAQAAPDLLKAYLVCEGGPVVIAQGGRRAVLNAGDLAFYDTRRPYEGVLGTDPVRPMRGMTFMFPPSLLPLSPTGIRELTATRTPGHRWRGRAHLAVPVAARPQRGALHTRGSGAAVLVCARGARHQAGP